MTLSKLLVVAVTVTVSVIGTSYAEEAAKEAKLAELVKVTGLYETFDQQRAACKLQAESMRPQLVKQLQQSTPNASDQFWKKFDGSYQKFVEASAKVWSTGELADLYAKKLGEQLTEEELTEMLRYYKSPVGQRDVVASRKAQLEWIVALTPRTQEAFQENLHLFTEEIKHALEECGAIQNDKRTACAAKGSEPHA